MNQDPEPIGESASWAARLAVRLLLRMPRRVFTGHVSLLFLTSVLCCSAWLTGYEHPVIDIINQRIEDLTGLEMDTAEELQVSGVGTDVVGEQRPVVLMSTAAPLIRI